MKLTMMLAPTARCDVTLWWELMHAACNVGLSGHKLAGLTVDERGAVCMKVEPADQAALDEAQQLVEHGTDA